MVFINIGVVPYAKSIPIVKYELFVMRINNLYSKITNLTYTPNVTRAVGLPWLEAGDRIGIMTSGGGFESFIFRRTMNGIQVLRDTLESYGEEVEKSVDAYAINTYTDTPISPYHT